MSTLLVIKEIKELHNKYKDTMSIFGKEASKVLKKYNYYIDDKYQSKIIKKTLYNIINNITIQPKCIICGEDAIFRDYKRGYSPACSASCMTKIQMKNKKPMTEKQKIQMVKRIKQTKLEKYGDENYNNSSNNKRVWTNEQKEKSKKTCLEKYGVDNISKIKDIKIKKYNTMIKKYGKIFPNIDQRKVRNTMEKIGKWLPLKYKKDFQHYRQVVDRLTRNNLSKIDNLDKRGINGNKDAWTLDHMYSVLDGFNHNIPAYIIANENNLKMVPYKENLKKGRKSSIKIEDLIKKIL